MPQAIMPGSYLALYGQQLQKTALTKALQAPVAPTPLQPQNIANMALLAQADVSLVNSMANMDTMLATVGIGISNGLVPPGAQPVIPQIAAAPIGALPAVAGGAGAAAPLNALPMAARSTATPNIFATASPPTAATAARNVTLPNNIPAPMMMAQLLSTLMTALSKLMPPAAPK